ncbi:MAG: M20/M25/M40 family metallo-hydrolase [Ruminococcaceae bacterium]|nr:M20/M25/M40 family metallo-hydrolase [Oscillospiraceae bacterium]
MKSFLEENKEQMYTTLRELCAIPAPSHLEHERAVYCKEWLERVGAEGVYIDDAWNVILPLNCTGSDKITVFVAHTDTVFPDREPMPYVDDGTLIRSPGIGDDTASLVVLLYVAKYFVEHKIEAPNGVLFVCNSCEEGLGNLKGTKQLFADYEGRIARFISFDSIFSKIADRCVGSHRYEVEVFTQGGHSYGAFGNRNAIAELARIINEIYAIEVPQIGNSKTTYNVGEISGGTSVNTIAQSAKMLCEYRSDNEECFLQMKAHFERIFSEAAASGLKISVTPIGERPCMGKVDLSKIEELTEICRTVIEDTVGIKVSTCSSSTDCNIPLSLGIPALCIGVYNGGGSHTREEWIEKASLPLGLEVGIRAVENIVKKVKI